VSVIQETVLDRYVGHVLVVQQRVLLCTTMCGLNSFIQSNTTQAYLKLSCAFGCTPATCCGPLSDRLQAFQYKNVRKEEVTR